MKHITRGTTLAASVALALLAAGRAHAASETPAPDGLLGYLAIPDVDTALTHADALGKLVAPEAPPGMLRQTLGAGVGDPDLSHLRHEPLVFVVAQAGGPGAAPSYGWLLPVTDAEPVAAAFAARGWKTRAAAGLIAAAPTEAALGAVDATRAGYGAIASVPATSDARLVIRTDRVMDAYGPMLRAGIAMMTAQMENAGKHGGAAGPSASAAQVLKLEGAAALALLGDAATIRVDLTLERDGVRGATSVTARPGSALADLATMTGPETNTSFALLEPGGVVAGAYRLDQGAVARFVDRVLGALADDPQFASLAGPDVRALIHDSVAASNGDLGFVMKPAAEGGFVAAYAFGGADETRLMDVVERSLAWLRSGPVSELNAAAGIELRGALTRNMRKHAGVTVHRVAITAQPAKGAPPEMTPMTKAMAKGYDLAFVHGYLLSSQDPAGLDRIIDRALAGPTGPGEGLKAGATFGPGRRIYVDYDFIGLMHSVAPLVPHPEHNPFRDLPVAGEPMTFALKLSDGVVGAEWRVPVQPFLAMKSAAQHAAAPATPKVR